MLYEIRIIWEGVTVVLKGLKTPKPMQLATSQSLAIRLEY